MDIQIWLLLIFICPAVYSYSETVYFERRCAHLVYELDTYKTIFVVWRGITVNREECKLTFRPTSYTAKSLRICVDAQTFKIHSSDCDIGVRISEDGATIKDYYCNQSFNYWCGNQNQAVHVTLLGANKSNISLLTEFRLKIVTSEVAGTVNTESVIFVAFLAGFIVVSTALCLIRHFSYKYCGRRRRGTNLTNNSNNNNNTDLPQDNSFLRGYRLPPPTYSYVMSHPVDTVPTVNQEGQTNSNMATAAEASSHVRFALSPSTDTMASSSTGSLPPSYSSLQLSNIQIIAPK